MANKYSSDTVQQPEDVRKRVQSLKDYHDQLERKRRDWEPLWRDTATYIDPNSDDFSEENERRQGAKKAEKVFDMTAILARDNLAAAHESMLTPRQSYWHGYKASIDRLNEVEEVKEYLEEVRARTFSARYRPMANFTAQIGAYYQQLDTFGTGAVFIDEQIGSGLIYKALHLNELYIADNFQGIVETVHRRFSLTAEQAVGALKKGKFEALPRAIIDTASRASSSQESYWFLHCVSPNPEAQGGYGRNSWAYSSSYLAYDYDFMCAESGYRTMPYAVGRYMVGPRETYGRAPGQTVLRDIQMLQEINKTILRGANRDADPPLFLPVRMGNDAFSMRPGAQNWGMIDPATGKPNVQPFRSEADYKALLEVVQDRRATINEAFKVTLFQILLEKPPNMTATEALLRAQEKGVLLTPTMGRQQSEFLGPMILRELDILTEAGQFEDLPMPDALREAGAGVEIVYDAPLNRLQKTDEAVGILRLLEMLAEPAKIKPEVYDVVDFPRSARFFAEASGAPAKSTRSLEEMAAQAKQREQQAAIEQATIAGPALAETAKGLTQAAETAANIPRTIPYVQPA